MASNTGKFITLEGGEGAGKTTCMAHVRQCLGDADIRFIVTREPGGTPVAEKIRDLLLDKTIERAALLALLILSPSIDEEAV